MPEKPEVITVAKTLSNKILGKKITNCNIYWDNIIAYPTTDLFKKKIIEQTIHNIDTRGKFIRIELDNDYLLVHLRMEGKFFFRKIGESLDKHSHVEFILDNSEAMRYNDVRKFGKMYLIKKEDIDKVKPLSELGLEYNDPNLTKEYLYNKIHNKKLPIKTVLLDQSIITGIGNIYVDEILFKSKINPTRKANLVSIDDCDNIIKATIKTLTEAIKLGGTTIRSFTSSEGVTGLFQNKLLVHGQGVCPICKSNICKIRVGGRGTYYCPKCQSK